ncbi:ATP-binding protein [Nocardioides jensenii]|uniref:ATP-binding protein n=1 Tax=Nocardioides jensenii TaxID=1843 RepID=UPI0009EC71F7|nr:ATP-binding protein [Nocardioides jensenii]
MPQTKPANTSHLVRRGTKAGRDMAALLSDFGHDLPTIPAPIQRAKESRVFKYAPRRGAARPGRGWSPAKAPAQAWRMTSDQAPVFWPFVSAPALPPTGAQMGVDQLSGGSFYCDPFGWVLRDDVPATNSNIFQIAKPGTGKSATTKAFCLRMMEFGYRTLILGDPKDEYERLCRALGVEPFVIGPGMSTRINPLAMGPLGHGWEHLTAEEQRRRTGIIFNRWLVLIRGLVGSMKIDEQRRVPFGPDESDVVRNALAILTGYAAGNTVLRETTMPRLWDLLRNPTEDLIRACEYGNPRQFLDETRLLRNALGELVTGTLAGLFDDFTNITVDWRAPIQSFSLSRLNGLGDEAVGIALLCMNSWGRGLREIAEPGDLRIVVRDEVWKQMRLGLAAVESFDADLRLSRGMAGEGGDIQFANLHKPSDLLSVGAADSQAAAIAKDLLELADIKILGGQKARVARELDSMLGLGPIAQDWVSGWAMQDKGRGLWCVGDSAYKVQTVLHPLEKQLYYTNEAIEAAG